jgi:raffinose/stachyose/melibiose transport system permease protein
VNRYTWRTGVREGVMIFIGLLFVAPVYIMFNVAFGGPSTQANPLLPTGTPTFANFVQAWQVGDLASGMLVSLTVTVFSVALTVFLSAFAAFPLARLTARWSRAVFYLVLFGLILPFFIALIPLYQTMHVLGLVGTPIALIILYTGHQFPLSVFLYVGFLRELPRDYEESAMIDGCTPARAFFSVVFPMLRPVTGTVVILNAVQIWNDFLTPLLFLGTGNLKTLPVGIYQFVGEYTTQWPLVFGGIVISVMPLLIVYLVMQRRIMTGFSSGLKG